MNNVARKLKDSVRDAEPHDEYEETLLVLLLGGNWDDHETLYRNWGKPTRAQVNQVSAKARDHENPMHWLFQQPDAEVQYKLVMQYHKVLGTDRPTVRSWAKVSKAEIKQMLNLEREGLSDEKIAEITGRCRGTVWHVLAREGKRSEIVGKVPNFYYF